PARPERAGLGPRPRDRDRPARIARRARAGRRGRRRRARGRTAAARGRVLMRGGAVRRLRALAMAAICGVVLMLLPACAPGDASGTPVEIAGGDPSGVYYNYGAHLASAAQR